MGLSLKSTQRYTQAHSAQHRARAVPPIAPHQGSPRPLGVIGQKCVWLVDRGHLAAPFWIDLDNKTTLNFKPTVADDRITGKRDSRTAERRSASRSEKAPINQPFLSSIFSRFFGQHPLRTSPQGTMRQLQTAKLRQRKSPSRKDTHRAAMRRQAKQRIAEWGTHICRCHTNSRSS